MSSQGDRPRHDRAVGQHGSGLRAADKRVNMAGAHCVCDGEVYGMNEVLRRRVKDSVILSSFGVCRYAWAFSKRMSRGTGCVNCARPGLWGSPSGNRGPLPGTGTSIRRSCSCVVSRNERVRSSGEPLFLPIFPSVACIGPLCRSFAPCAASDHPA